MQPKQKAFREQIVPTKKFCSQNIIKVFKIRISFHGFLPTFALIRDKHCWNLSWQIISVINGVIKVGNHKSIERPKGYLPSPKHTKVTKPHLPQPCFMLGSMIEYLKLTQFFAMDLILKTKYFSMHSYKWVHIPWGNIILMFGLEPSDVNSAQSVPRWNAREPFNIRADSNRTVRIQTEILWYLRWYEFLNISWEPSNKEVAG